MEPKYRGIDILWELTRCILFTTQVVQKIEHWKQTNTTHEELKKKRKWTPSNHWPFLLTHTNSKLWVRSSFTLWMNTVKGPTKSSREMWLQPETEFVQFIEQGRTWLSQNLHSLSREEHWSGRGTSRTLQAIVDDLDRNWSDWLTRFFFTIWCCLGTLGSEQVVVKVFEVKQAVFQVWGFPFQDDHVYHRGILCYAPLLSDT